jgi:hypothetical protein
VDATDCGCVANPVGPVRSEGGVEYSKPCCYSS